MSSHDYITHVQDTATSLYVKFCIRREMRFCKGSLMNSVELIFTVRNANDKYNVD